jgi:hypothetical protein
MIKYRLCTIKTENGQFIALGKPHATIAEAKATIDGAYSALQNSIKL